MQRVKLVNVLGRNYRRTNRSFRIEAYEECEDDYYTYKDNGKSYPSHIRIEAELNYNINYRHSDYASIRSQSYWWAVGLLCIS